MKDYMGLVASLPCACCGAEPVEVHHIRAGQGMGQRAADTLTIPLCPDCHRGRHGVHGDHGAMHLRKTSELQMLGETFAKVLTIMQQCR